MRSNIVKLRDNLKSSFDEHKIKDSSIASLKDEIIVQKLSLISTVNSELSSVGCKSIKEQRLNIQKAPDFEDIFEIVLDKIQNIKLSTDGDKNEILESIKQKNIELNNELRNHKEKLERKEKDFNLMSKQKDTLRAQLGSAVEMMNAKDFELSQSRATDSDVLPSLQVQLQALQEDSRQTEVTRDITEQLLENFEKNDRQMREKLQQAISKLKTYKEKYQTQKLIIKDLQKGSPGALSNAEVKAQLTSDIKKKIREEEISKRDREIERQRKLMSQKSEEQ